MTEISPTLRKLTDTGSTKLNAADRQTAHKSQCNDTSFHMVMTRGHKTFEYSIDQICEYCLAQTIYELLSYLILSNEVKQAKSDIFSAKICFNLLSCS